MFSMLIYPETKHRDSSELLLFERKTSTTIADGTVFDVFPNEEQSLTCVKRVQSYGNRAVLFLNTPWAYHSVNSFSRICPKQSTSKRKYMYASFDLKKSKKSFVQKTEKNRGCNDSTFWRHDSVVVCEQRRQNFLNCKAK